MNKINLSELKWEKLRKTIPTGDKDFPIEIYNPDKAQTIMLKDLINSSMEVSEKGIKAKVTDNDIIVKVLGELTNIHLDVKNKDLVNNILDNPSGILVKVKREINHILDEIFIDYYEDLKSIGKLPEEIQEELFKIGNKGEINEEKLAKEREKEELRKKLAELEADE